MAFKHLLLIAALLAVHVSCTQTEDAEILAQVSANNQFGQAISAMVQMHSMVPDARVAEIKEFLLEIRAQIETQQDREKSSFDARQGQCNTDIETFGGQVNNLETALNEAEKELEDLTNELSEKTQQVQDLRSQISEEQNDFSEYQTQLEDAETTYAENKASFEDAIRSCEEAVRLLTELARSRTATTTSFAQNGVMFVQLSQKFETVKSLLESNKHNTFVQPIIDVLMELSQSSHVDVAQVQQIIELIETLLQRLRDGLRERFVQNQHTTEGLKNLIADLQTQIRDHNQQLTIYEDRITAITDRREQLTNVVERTQTVLDVTKSLLESTKSDCIADADAYNSAESGRQSQLLTLQRLIDYFDSKVSDAVTNVSD